MISSFINRQLDRGKQAISNATKKFGSSLTSLSPGLGANLNQVMPGTVTKSTPSNTFQPKTEPKPTPQGYQAVQPGGILKPAPMATGAQLQRNLLADTKAQQQMSGGLGSGGSGGFGISPEEARQQAEEARLRAEQEAKNESFRQKLGSDYGDIRNKFGGILSTFESKLRDLPNSIRQLSEQYKGSIGGKETQELGQIEQRRQQVQAQQKSGLASIAQDAARNIQSGARRLGSLGMASSAAGMFQKAIQNAANKSAQDLLVQAANNYQGLDNEVKKVKSAYSTMLKEIDSEDNARIQQIQREIPDIISKINERLQKSGEFERIDKEQLNNTYISELQARFEQVESQAKSLREQAEQWRRDNESRINQLQNKIVQDFIPREITPKELLKPRQQTSAPTEEGGLGLNRLRATPEDEEEITTPSGLQEILRRRRQNTNL
jgi:hypothetical protein